MLSRLCSMLSYLSSCLWSTLHKAKTKKKPDSRSGFMTSRDNKNTDIHRTFIYVSPAGPGGKKFSSPAWKDKPGREKELSGQLDSHDLQFICCIERGQAGDVGKIPWVCRQRWGTLLQVTGASEPPISNTVVFLQTSLKPSRQPTGHTYWLGEEVLLKTTKELALEFWKCYKLDKKNPRSRRMS